MLVVVLLAVPDRFAVAISYFMQEYLALAYGVRIRSARCSLRCISTMNQVSFPISSSGSILLLLAPPVGMILWFLWGGAAPEAPSAAEHQALS